MSSVTQLLRGGAVFMSCSVQYANGATTRTLVFSLQTFWLSLFGAELFIGRLAPQTHRVAAEAPQHISPQFLLYKAHHSQPLCSGKINLAILDFLCTWKQERPWRRDVSFPQGHCKSFLVFGCQCCCLATEPGFLLNVHHSHYECMLQD